MLLRLLFLFITVPLVELVLLMKLAEVTNWRMTLLIVLVTGAVGAWLARLQGWRTYRKIQQQLAAGQMPTESLIDAVMIFVAGALLLTPGLLTDCFGITLLLPLCRQVYRRRLVQWLKANVRIQNYPSSQPPTNGDIVVDSYVVERDEDGPHRTSRNDL